MPLNPYESPQQYDEETKRNGGSVLAAGAAWGAYVATLIVLFDPPPQPRYDGSWEPGKVLLVALVFYHPRGLLLGLMLGVVAMYFAWRVRAKYRGLFVWLNLATWLAVYASIPLWNRYFRSPESWGE